MSQFQGDSTTEGGGGGGEQRAVQSNIKKDDRFDVRWEGMPFKYRKVGRGPKATREKVCIMPLWLRNLWPTSEFDPCSVWEQAKEEEEEAVREKTAATAGKPSKSGGGKSGGGGGGGGGSKKGGGGAAKLSKKETIQADQARKRTEVSPTINIITSILYCCCATQQGTTAVVRTIDCNNTIMYTWYTREAYCEYRCCYCCCCLPVCCCVPGGACCTSCVRYAYMYTLLRTDWYQAHLVPAAANNDSDSRSFWSSTAVYANCPVVVLQAAVVTTYAPAHTYQL